MYQGRTAAQSGLVFGHENMGIVTEIGAGVSLLKVGDRIVLPFNVADGRCRNCEEGRTAFCTGVNPGFAGGAYGYVSMVSLKGRITCLLKGSTELPPPWVTSVRILSNAKHRPSPGYDHPHANGTFQPS